jgi:PAS domain S-box-containing protein
MASVSHRPDLSALLHAQQAVLGALVSSATPAEALAGALDALTGALGWPAGAVWERAADGGLACTHGRGAEPALAERAMAEGQPVWGPGGTVAVPLLSRQGAAGALELPGQGAAEPEPELVSTLGSLGLLIGRALDRSMTEAELRRSDALLRATLNAAFDAVVAMDASGAIVAVNPAAEAMFGYSAEELVGQELAAALIPPELREPHRRGLANYIARGEERVLGHPLELSALRADGSEFPVEVAVRRLDVPGPPVFTGFIRDLTETRAVQARLRLFADEQAALRRVATLVAQDAEPAAVFAAVTEEVAKLSGAETANMIRYQADSELVIGAWSEPGAANLPVGATLPLDSDTAAPQIFRTGRPMRVDAFVPGEGQLADALRRLEFTAAVGAPIVLDGHLWGALIVRAATPFPPGEEDRLQDFAELAAQALANAEARAQLAASRARLVSAGVAERRRLERNLHDGAQQRLVSLALLLRLASRYAGDDPERARRELAVASEELEHALAELRELARGLHPAVLTDHGLEVALRSICDRAPLPVDIAIELSSRPSEAVQAAAYFVVTEALTNVAKYAHATTAAVRLHDDDGALTVDVTDDGVGGADPAQGTGLNGLVDRVEALGGRLKIDSPPDRGTRIHVKLPL